MAVAAGGGDGDVDMVGVEFGDSGDYKDWHKGRVEVVREPWAFGMVAVGLGYMV